MSTTMPSSLEIAQAASLRPIGDVADELLHQGNAASLDPLAISWRRCMDMNDRNLRNVITGLGGRAHGAPRETGFDITAASEIMGLVAVARDLADLRERLGRITVGQT